MAALPRAHQDADERVGDVGVHLEEPAEADLRRRARRRLRVLADHLEQFVDLLLDPRLSVGRAARRLGAKLVEITPEGDDYEATFPRVVL